MFYWSRLHCVRAFQFRPVEHLYTNMPKSGEKWPEKKVCRDEQQLTLLEQPYKPNRSRPENGFRSDVPVS